MRYDFYVRCREDLEAAVENFGIVPYFANAVPGFSLQERCDPRVLWSDTGEDSWAWKGPVIRATHCAYGKFFFKKAAYVSREVFLDLANYRRGGYDLQDRYDYGMVSHGDKELYDRVAALGPVLSRELRQEGGYAYRGRWQQTEGKKGFDGSMTRLQEQCYVVISDFVYTLDRHGLPRGWGVAEYSTPERWFGPEFGETVYDRTPEESFERLFDLLRGYFPEAGEKELRRILK